MADWFKFYENDLDETRLQYAIAKMPEVVSVWVGILSECCRHKSGTVSWGDDAIELFGFSRRLGISVQKTNECINLLCEIRYIEKSDGMLNILKWNDKQSEYCQKKAKKLGLSTDSVGTVSGQCRPRGEERRLEERGRELPPLSRISKEKELVRVAAELKGMACLSDYPKGSTSYNRRVLLKTTQEKLREELGVVA